MLRVDPVDLTWSVVEPYGVAGVYMTGDLAIRIRDLLSVHEDHSFAEYVSQPDCHGAAMYAAGLVDHLERLGPKRCFSKIYADHPSVFTYEPQPGSVLVHLLREELPCDSPAFEEYGTPHSVILLDEVAGHPVCFEKKGDRAAGFAWLDDSESCYAAPHWMYALPRNRLVDGDVHIIPPIDSSWDHLSGREPAGIECLASFLSRLAHDVRR